MFKERSTKLERIDTGDYTVAEYDRFLSDIRLVNRFAGDNWALRRTLLDEVANEDLKEFSVLDVGAGSGELLRTIAKKARKQKRTVKLYGLELNERSAESILEESIEYDEINAVRGDALKLPFCNDSFDYVISSLFAHHLKNRQIVDSLKEMSRVSKRGFFVIDLHRHPMAYASYKVFCVGFRISQLVREDGSLSILRGFKVNELNSLGEKAGLQNIAVRRCFPYRLVLSGK